jgi:hypothetical protein
MNWDVHWQMGFHGNTAEHELREQADVIISPNLGRVDVA